MTCQHPYMGVTQTMCERGRCLWALSDTREFSCVLLMAAIISKVTNAINVELVNYPTGFAVVAQPLLILTTTAHTNNHSIITRLCTATHNAAIGQFTHSGSEHSDAVRCGLSTELSNTRPTGLGGEENRQKHAFALCAEVDKYPRQLQVLKVCHPALAEGGCGETIGRRPPAEHVLEHPANRWVQQVDLVRWFHLMTHAWRRPSLNFAAWKVS